MFGAVRPLVLVAIGTSLLLGAAAIAFARERPVSETQFPVLEPHPATEHDLALFRYGSRVRASSAFWPSLHHPGFVVDGYATPSGTEKWASAPEDASPWVEVLWDKPRHVSRVVLTFSGRLEGGGTMRDYTLICLSQGQGASQFVVHDNREDIARHEVGCDNAEGVRVEFRVGSGTGNDLVRLYELEAIGQ
ncbi:discoidin domain-containing protein [Hyalangium versicolor]|uniref:discoidin domain-containing protein n=1 Tax=Hyalangium versicolor TaxID=2861190 RepID=UPI001CCFA278|nr:discoidin domain-containing protein [Hyalangium versicolor]